MVENLSEYNIAILIAKYIASNLSEEESERLENWKSASDENISLFNRLIDPDNFNDLQQMASQYDEEEAWENIQNQIIEKPKFFVRKWIYYAAAAVIALLLCSYFMKNYLISIPSEKITNQVIVDNNTIKPGMSKATLILDDGSALDLDDEQAFDIEEKEGTKIKKESSILSYEGKTDSKEVVYNQIIVPRGGEYSVILSDGSKVYLNAMSSLRYPVNFLTNIRTVELTGEAYFEVKKSDKPFIVTTPDSKIEVLGTSFNVSSYKEDKIVRTTLVEGSLKINLLENDGEDILLKPSQQLAYNRNKKEHKVNTVDVSPYIAWKNGIFYFKDWELHNIMTYLSHWYDFNVIYENEKVREYRFGGKFNRYEDIEPILDLLNETGKIIVKIEGNTIILKEKKK